MYFFLPASSLDTVTQNVYEEMASITLLSFGVLMTIVMEMGLIHPPVGLNIVWGVMPFVGLMFVAVVVICLVPGIATGFPDWVMGPPTR